MPVHRFNQHATTFGDIAVGERFQLLQDDHRDRRKVDERTYAVHWPDGQVTQHQMPRGSHAFVRRAS